MKCSARIAVALRFDNKTPQQIADELFLSRDTVKRVLTKMLAEKLLRRWFFHNQNTNRPDFRYGLATEWRYTPPAEPLSDVDRLREKQLKTILGDWDSIKPTTKK